MNDDRHLLLTVAVDVGQSEARGQLEVQLNRSHLPFSFQGILHENIYLRTVKRPFLFNDDILPGTHSFIENATKNFLGTIPYFRIAYELVGTQAQAKRIIKLED